MSAILAQSISPMRKSVKLALTKSTPGTHVYATEEKGVICRQIYLTKSELPADPPKSITLVVEWERG